MIAYDTSHDPPSPMEQVTVANNMNRRLRHNVLALFDTGADVTAIPTEFAESLRLYPVRRLQFEDLHGNMQILFTYKVRITIDKIVIPQIEIVLTGFTFAVLGRDVLNRFNLHLYGPQRMFEMEDPAQR